MNLFLLLIICLLHVCACFNQQSPKHDDNTLFLAISNPPEALDPRFATSAVASQISALIYSPLCILNEDLLPTPFLATRIEQRDPLTYEAQLRANLRFHDNTPLTARDVAYTFLSLSQKDVNSPQLDSYKWIEDVRVVNDETVQFILKEAHAAFAIDLCGMGIVSKKRCENRSDKCRHEYLGSGPFRVEHHDEATQTLSLAAHEQWFEGKPSIAHIVVRVVRDPVTRVLELKSGKTDFVAGAVSPILQRTFAHDRHLNVIKKPGLGYAYIAMNLRGPKPESDRNSEENRTRRALADQKVRTAIAAAIDVDRILAAKFNGSATRASGLIPQAHWAKSASQRPPRYDVALAKRLMDEAGFKDRGEKLGRFRITFSTGTDRSRQSIVQIYKSELERIGIKVRLRVQDWGALYQDIKQGNFEMFSAMWVPVVEPDLLYWVFHSDNIPNGDKGGGNRGAYRDALVDSWLDEAHKSMDQNVRKDRYQRIESRLLETMPYIPLWFESDVVVANRDLKNYTHSRTGSILGLRRAYLERKAASL